MEQKKENRGGRREGAGRKKTMAKAIKFCASQETVDILATKENKSEFINKAILEYEHKLPVPEVVKDLDLIRQTIKDAKQETRIKIGGIALINALKEKSK